MRVMLHLIHFPTKPQNHHQLALPISTPLCLRVFVVNLWIVAADVRRQKS